MPQLPDGHREVHVIRLGTDEEPPAGNPWILVVCSPQHAFGEVKVHPQGQTHMAPPDDMVMSIYNAQEIARDLGLSHIYVRDSTVE